MARAPPNWSAARRSACGHGRAADYGLRWCRAAVQPPTLLSEPRWACPTNTPLPYGPDGPIKNHLPRPTAAPSGPQEYDTEYYVEWEQEYAALGGPPFPAPTPYIKQRVSVRLRPDRQSAARCGCDGCHAKPPASPTATDQLYVLSTTWHNRGAPLVIEPVRQLVITAIQQPSGGQLGGIWTASQQALELATQHGVAGSAHRRQPGQHDPGGGNHHGPPPHSRAPQRG